MRVLLVLLTIMAGVAYAQQPLANLPAPTAQPPQQPQSSVAEQVLAQKLNEEISGGLQLRAQIIRLQAEIAALKAKLEQPPVPPEPNK